MPAGMPAKAGTALRLPCGRWRPASDRQHWPRHSIELTRAGLHLAGGRREHASARYLLPPSAARLARWMPLVVHDCAQMPVNWFLGSLTG